MTACYISWPSLLCEKHSEFGVTAQFVIEVHIHPQLLPIGSICAFALIVD
jgi:hypothetical protein